MVKAMVAGQSPAAPFRLDMVDGMNAPHAKDFAPCTKAETTELLQRGAAVAAGDSGPERRQQLATKGTVLADAPPMTVEELIAAGCSPISTSTSEHPEDGSLTVRRREDPDSPISGGVEPRSLRRKEVQASNGRRGGGLDSLVGVSMTSMSPSSVVGGLASPMWRQRGERAMTTTRPEHVKGSPGGSSCSRRRRSSRGAATSWRGGGRSCRGSASTRPIASRPTKGALPSGPLPRRSQLLVYHFMFGPEYTAGCPTCSTIADGFNGFSIHLANHDVMLWAVSRAPLAKLQAYKRRMGWSFPWASSFDGDFNYDFGVSFTKEQHQSGTVEYTSARWMSGPSSPMSGRVPSMARMWRRRRGKRRHERVRARGRRRLPHLLGVHARLDGLWGMYQWLDRAPRGRNETMVRDG